MRVEPNPIPKNGTNFAGPPERMGYDWSQFEHQTPPCFTANSPTSLSSWGERQRSTPTAVVHAQDQSEHRALSVLAQTGPRIEEMWKMVVGEALYVPTQIGQPMDRGGFSDQLNLDILREFVVRGARDFPVLLVDALRDLNAATDEAAEEGFSWPCATALENARRLVNALYRISPRRFEVYPTPDGEIAIDASGGHGRSVLVLCDSKGGALCLVNMNGNHRRARYSTTERLPDGFMREALAELERSGD